MTTDKQTDDRRQLVPWARPLLVYGWLKSIVAGHYGRKRNVDVCIKRFTW